MSSEAIGTWSKRRSWFAASCVFGTLGWGVSRFSGYIKDDAFISLRYARHLAEGRGLRFNIQDDAIEGFSNFLWVVLEAVGLSLGFDGEPLALGLSLVASFALLAYTWMLAERLSGDSWVACVAAAGLSAFPMLALWSQGGLAGPLLATAFVAAIYHACRAPKSDRDLAAMALWCTVACLIRPEGHALWLGCALYLLVPRQNANSPFEATKREILIGASFLGIGFAAILDALFGSGRMWRQLPAATVVLAIAGVCGLGLWIVSQRVASRSRSRHPLVLFVALSGPVLLGYHAWRLAYFGSVFPNTSLVKLAGGTRLIGPGLDALGQLAMFSGTGVLAVLAAVAITSKPERPVKTLCLTLIAVFALYLVKIGGDEMPYHRLFLPVTPLLFVLAAQGLWQATGVLSKRAAGLARISAMAVFLTVSLSTIVGGSQKFSLTQAGLRDAHGAMARYIAKHGSPGDRVVFQDMGAAPFAADEQQWIDPIGLTNKRVALARQRYGMNPFVPKASANERVLREVTFRREMRDYLLGLDPEWIAGVVYFKPGSRGAEVPDFQAGDTPALRAWLKRWLQRSPHYHRIFDDPRFLRNYDYVHVWKRSEHYFLVLFRRKALERLPRP